jgi:hypothetical protein
MISRLLESGRWTACLLALCLAVLVVGCGGKKGMTITGKVTAGGKDVTAGTLIFAPIPSGQDQNPGAPSSTEVGSDGTYTAKAVVPGKVRVTYTPPGDKFPEGYTPKSSEPAPKSPFNGLAPKQPEIEVKAGNTKIDIELGPQTRK